MTINSYKSTSVTFTVIVSTILLYKYNCKYNFRHLSDDDVDGIRGQCVPPSVQGFLGGRRPQHKPPLLLVGV